MDLMMLLHGPTGVLPDANAYYHSYIIGSNPGATHPWRALTG
jgi:hypothetical protein